MKIGNAGHELKTPLAVISANTEMEEMLGNNSEWNESTKEQIAKLTKLINRLISLARAGETGEITLAQELVEAFHGRIRGDDIIFTVVLKIAK